jgi:hypothetical protein
LKNADHRLMLILMIEVMYSPARHLRVSRVFFTP